MPAKGPAKYTLISLKRYTRAWKFFLFLCQNCAAFITVLSMLFLQLRLDSSSSSGRQRNAFICPCVERGVEHAAPLHPSLWSHLTNPPTLLLPSTAQFVEGVIYLFSLGFPLPGGCCWSSTLDDLVSQSCFSMNFKAIWNRWIDIQDKIHYCTLLLQNPDDFSMSIFSYQLLLPYSKSQFFLNRIFVLHIWVFSPCDSEEKDKKHSSLEWKEVPK